MTDKQTVREGLEDVTGRCVVNISTYPLEVLTSAKKALTALEGLYDKAALVEVLEKQKLQRKLDESGYTLNDRVIHNLAIDAAIKAVGEA